MAALHESDIPKSARAHRQGATTVYPSTVLLSIGLPMAFVSVTLALLGYMTQAYVVLFAALAPLSGWMLICDVLAHVWGY